MATVKDDEFETLDFADESEWMDEPYDECGAEEQREVDAERAEALAYALELTGLTVDDI